ncbi:hypothetical protein [uncultured Clostridium sp.]|uniref:hypothetical protein n=1 Tax=uncultured Clostridium sp. TaxID=59620 RepID=UPI0028EC2BBC|nr:hypothetical protein [uncultured Clostridium sp.]
MPETISKNVTYPSVSNIDYDEIERIIAKTGGIPDYLKMWSEETYLNKVKNSEDKEFFLKNNIESQLIKIYHCTILVKHIKDTNLNACCIPGSRKIYITTNGDFLICEKIDR